METEKEHGSRNDRAPAWATYRALAQTRARTRGGHTITEADAVWAVWTSWVNERSTRFRRAVDDAEGRYANLVSLVNLGLDAANTAAPALPGGAFIVGGLSLLTGLMLKRSGEDKRVFAEKKDSYNAGIEEGKRLVLEALRPNSERVIQAHIENIATGTPT